MPFLVVVVDSDERIGTEELAFLIDQPTPCMTGNRVDERPQVTPELAIERFALEYAERYILYPADACFLHRDVVCDCVGGEIKISTLHSFSARSRSSSNGRSFSFFLFAAMKVFADASLSNELRTFEEIFEAFENEFCIIVVEFAELDHYFMVDFREEVCERSNASRELSNETISSDLVSSDCRAIAHEEDKVPDTDAVHGHETWLCPECILCIVEAYKERQGSPIFLMVETGMQQYHQPT